MAKKDKTADAAPSGDIRLAEHPRARRQIRQAKGWGGLGAFLLVAYLSLQAGVPVADALSRAVVGGVIGMLVAWAAAVTVWRQLALAEIEAHRRRLKQLYEEAQAEHDEAVAAGKVV